MLSGYDLFALAAVNAVPQWRYKLTLADGEHLEVVKFSLKN